MQMENSVKSKLVEFKNRAYSLLTIQIPEYSSEYQKNKTANEILGNIAGKLPETSTVAAAADAIALFRKMPISTPRVWYLW